MAFSTGSSELGSAAAVYKLEVEEAQKSLGDSKLFGGSKIGQIASFNRQKRKLCKLRDEWRAKEKYRKYRCWSMNGDCF